MIVSILVASQRAPVGGVTAVYEYANGLRRRGHHVRLVHVPYLENAIRSLEDLHWFQFEPGMEHLLADDLYELDLPPADFLLNVFVPVPPEAGLPLNFVQGLGIFDAATEDRVLFAPYPKICIARWLVQAAAGMGVPPEQLVYVPYGIKHGKYRITTPIDDRPLQVSMLYHNHFAKAPLVGLEALAEVQRRMPGVRAIAFGTEDPVTAIPPGVEFVKSPPQDVLVHDIYNHSRVFLCSSTIEGFGFCSVEAMACGAALVTTDNKGSDDFAVHDDTALVAPPDDPTALADHVETLLRDDDRRIAIATRGTAHARQFDWDVSAHRLETFFEQYAADPDHYRRATRPTVEYLLPPPIKERR